MKENQDKLRSRKALGKRELGWEVERSVSEVGCSLDYFLFRLSQSIPIPVYPLVHCCPGDTLDQPWEAKDVKGEELLEM